MLLKPPLLSHNFPLGKYFTATADIYNVTAASKLSDSPIDTNDVKDGSFEVNNVPVPLASLEHMMVWVK